MAKPALDIAGFLAWYACPQRLYVKLQHYVNAVAILCILSLQNTTVSEKGITYTDEFKSVAIKEYENWKSPREIFEESGFDIEIVGIERASSSLKRWRKAYKENGVAGLEDARKYYSGLERELSFEEKFARLEAQNALLRAENELLKKLDLAERMLVKKKKN